MKYLIAFTARSGSTHLCSLLGSHPEIVCWGEILHRTNKPLYQGRGPKWILYKHYLAAHGLIRAAGGKVHPGQSRQCKFQAKPWRMLCEDRSIRVIHLRRENTLEQAVSILRKNTNTEPGKRVHASPKRLVGWMEDMASLDAEIGPSFAGHEMTHVTYEELCSNEAETCDRLLDFLGFDPFPLRSNREKIGMPLKRSLLNYQEVHDYLMGTKWEHCLE